MSCVIKRLSVLAIAVCLVPLAAHANGRVPHVVTQNVVVRNVAVTTAPDEWVTNFGFLPINSKTLACHVVQKGFWPRPQGCVR